MKIRKANREDCSSISDIGRRSFSHAFGYLFPEDGLLRYLDQTYALDKILNSLVKANNVYFVAEVDGKLIGFLKIKLNSQHPFFTADQSLQIQKLYVDPLSFSQGAGGYLMRSAEKAVDHRGFDSVWLAVHEENHRAIQFYQTMGYQEQGGIKHRFEHDDMQFKVLDKKI